LRILQGRADIRCARQTQVPGPGIEL